MPEFLPIRFQRSNAKGTRSYGNDLRLFLAQNYTHRELSNFKVCEICIQSVDD